MLGWEAETCDVWVQVVWGLYGDAAVWYYTNKQGELCRNDSVSELLIYKKFANPLDEHFVVAVRKYPRADSAGNDTELVSTAQLKAIVAQAASAPERLCVIQRFIRCKGQYGACKLVVVKVVVM